MSEFDPSLMGLHSRDEENVTEEIKPEPVHQDAFAVILPVIIILGVIGLIVWKIHSVWDESRPLYASQYLTDKEVSVKILSDEMKTYVQHNYPINDKRLVVYAPELNSDTCPYRRDFVRGLKNEKDNPQWKEVYDFVPQVRQIYSYTREEQERQLKDLENFVEKVCGYICIIDMHENWVFEIKNGSALPDALRVFKKGR